MDDRHWSSECRRDSILTIFVDGVLRMERKGGEERATVSSGGIDVSISASERTVCPRYYEMSRAEPILIRSDPSSSCRTRFSIYAFSCSIPGDPSALEDSQVNHELANFLPVSMHYYSCLFVEFHVCRSRHRQLLWISSGTIVLRHL
jgi:hypothetical protein